MLDLVAFILDFKADSPRVFRRTYNQARVRLNADSDGPERVSDGFPGFAYPRALKWILRPVLCMQFDGPASCQIFFLVFRILGLIFESICCIIISVVKAPWGSRAGPCAGRRPVFRQGLRAVISRVKTAGVQAPAVFYFCMLCEFSLINEENCCKADGSVLYWNQIMDDRQPETRPVQGASLPERQIGMGVNYFSQFLAKRGFATEEQFMSQFEYDLSPIAGTDEACALLHDMDKSAVIALLSDFDVDGLMSGLIGYAGLHLLGFTGMYVMPRDIKAGYEFLRSDVDRARGCNLLITSDVGIACIDALVYAKSLGMTVIVTDHHVPGKKLPPADIIVDYLLDKAYQDKNPAVCGAFTLWQIFDRYLDLYQFEYEPDLWRDLKGEMTLLRHFAALATLSDSMPLMGRNHVIVAEMLRFFNFINPLSGSPAIVNCVSRDGVMQNVLNNFHTFVLQFQDNYYTGFTQRFLEFSLIPAMNSVRRMYADTALVYMMFFGTQLQAEDCAESLAELNQDRKELVAASLQAMMDDYTGGQVLMTEAPAGILGLLATRVTDQIGLPSVVLNNTPDLDAELGEFCYYGSARSLPWYPLLTSVNASGYAICAGHEVACGIKVPVRYVDMLNEFLEHDCGSLLPVGPDDVVTPENIRERYDVIMDFEANMEDFLEDVELFMRNVKRFGPFGSGLPAPRVLLVFNRRNGAVKLLKNGKHVKITLVSAGEGFPREMPNFQVLLWNTTIDDIAAACDETGTVYVTGYLQNSYFMGTRFMDFVGSPALDMRAIQDGALNAALV